MQITRYFSFSTKQIFLLLLALQLIYMLAASFDAGISADEFRHYEQAKKVYNYFSTLGKDKSALGSTRMDPMQYNGQSFDNLMYVIEKIFNTNDKMELRHFFNALTGWLIILITGLIVKEIIGYRAALFAIIVLFLSPRFIGHALNNNKDIPFAFGFMLSLLGILFFLKQLPKPRWSTLLILTTGIAFAISIRMAGLLSVCFLVMLSGIHFLSVKPVNSFFSMNKIQLLKKTAFYIIPVSVVSYFLGILFWPFMLEAPFKNLKEVLGAMSSHPLALNQLFEGKMYMSNNLPWYYTIKYILLTYPLIVLSGLAVFTGLIYKYRKQYNFLSVLLIFFPFVFVVTWMSIKNSNIYGEIRHLLFIYPLAVILCTLGFDMLLKLTNSYNRRFLNVAFYCILLLLIFHPVKHIMSNYPYSYIYFNELSGGVNKNWTAYETDYFQHSLKHSTKWLISNELKKINPDDTVKIKILTNDALNVDYYLRNMTEKVVVEYSRYYEKAAKDWDYAIFYCSYISPLQLKNKLWPPAGTIHTEKVDEAIIAAVVKRPSKEDFLGFKEMEKMNSDGAKAHFENVLKDQPDNEEVLAGMARIYLMKHDYQKAIEYADKSLKYTPDYVMGLYYKSIALNETKDFRGAMALAQRMISMKNDLAEAYFQKAVSCYGLGSPNEAMSEVQKAINYKNEYYEAYMFYGHMLMNQKQYGQALEKIYSKVLKFRQNDLVAQIKIAQCQYFLKNTGNAEEMLKRLMVNNSTHFEVVKLACRLSLDKNNLQEAYNYLLMMRQISNNSEVSVLRALFLLRVNDAGMAKKSAEEAVSLDKNNLEALQLLQSFNKPSTPESIMKQQKTQVLKPSGLILKQQ